MTNRTALSLAAGGLLLLLCAPAACRRKEAPPSGTAAAPATSAPTAPPDVRPEFREAAEKGKPAFEGLREPRGIAVDGRGRLWAADFGNSRLVLFDSAGGWLGALGGFRGNGKYQLIEPADVAIRGEDVFVADTWNGRVQHYSTGGEFKDTTVVQLYGPRGIAVAPDGTVWVTDTGNSRVVSVRVGEAPRFLGRVGAGPQEFASPLGIATAPSGNVYVADIGNHRIQVLGADGRFLRRFAVADWKGPMEPYLAVDANETVYASVPAAGLVISLDRNGRVLSRWTADAAGTRFKQPVGLAVDASAKALYVCDRESNTILRVDLGAGRK